MANVPGVIKLKTISKKLVFRVKLLTLWMRRKHINTIVFVSSRRIEWPPTWWPPKVDLIFELRSSLRSTCDRSILHHALSMRLGKANTVTLCASIPIPSEVIDRKYLLTSDNLRWPFEGLVINNYLSPWRTALVVKTSPRSDGSDEYHRNEAHLSILPLTYNGEITKMTWRKATEIQNLRYNCYRYRWPHHHLWISSRILWLGQDVKVAKKNLPKYHGKCRHLMYFVTWP